MPKLLTPYFCYALQPFSRQFISSDSPISIRLFLVFILLNSCAAVGNAQYSAPIKDSLFSTILNEQRTIEIILPNGYAEEKNKNFDVWYVVDGEWNTHTFTNIQSYLTSVGFAPSSIIVSVPNRYVDGYNYRNRDLTPTITDLPNSGGAKKFLGFLQNELMPYIKNKYSATGSNGLFGASYGGLFALYALLEQPQLFRYHLLSDPAFQYGDDCMVKLVAQQLPKISFTNTVLYIGGRSGSSYIEMARAAMDSVLKISSPKGLYWKSVLYDNETHNSVSLKTYYDGLKYTYSGYTARNNFFYISGVVLKDRPVKQYLDTDQSDIRYTSDGTVPTLSSPKVDSWLLVADPEQTIVKLITPSGRFDRIIPMPLHSGTYISPKPLSKKIRSAGKLDTSSRIKNGSMNGYVTIHEDSYYVMHLTPSPGTQFYLNDSLLIAYDAQKGNARQTIILPLRKGNYALRLEHRGGVNTPEINFGFYRSQDGQDKWWKNVIIYSN